MLRLKIIIILFAAVGLSVTSVMATRYIPTPQSTSLPPETITYDHLVADEFELLYETEFFRYYFRDDRDIIAIRDKRNDYLWKTGLDLEFNRNLEDACDLVPEADRINCEPLEDRLNTTFIGIANSLLTIEFFDNTNNIRRISSASFAEVSSRLATVNNNPNHRRLDVNFETLDIQIKVHIHFDNHGIRYEIRDEEISGTGVRFLAGVMLTPFMGASGGAKAFWDPEQFGFRRIVQNPKLDGYILVPDGPGALIRFVDHGSSLTTYNGSVFGENLSESTYYYNVEPGYLPLKSPAMPVFGVAHGNRQAAFVAYALSGAENMNIVVSPRQNLTNYTFVYPLFQFNSIIHQVFNRRGDGYFRLMDERHRFDISIRYDFLANDGSEDGLPADYVGMALRYREFLKSNDLLPSTTREAGDVGLRLDFVMSDIRRSVFGVQNVVVTTANQVLDILKDVHSLGLENVSSGLLGWQRGGITSGHPARTTWSRAIGTQRQFRELNEQVSELGFDISLSQDYVTIHRDQVNFLNTAAKHVNGWFLEHRLRENMPVTVFGVARPTTSARWLLEQSQRISRVGFDSLTIEGLGNTLISDFSQKDSSRANTLELFQHAFRDVNENFSIAATSPNQYVWRYIDRFLQAPVFTSQHLIQTDAVPFLQLVINNNMEMYAPYSNFSFYTTQDILRMIDFNLAPSFVLTHSPSFALSLTNSRRFFSTEYNEYRELIRSIHSKVNAALSPVRHAQWIDRHVIENGVIMNVYDNNHVVVINYTQNPVVVLDTVINPQSARVINMEERP